METTREPAVAPNRIDVEAPPAPDVRGGPSPAVRTALFVALGIVVLVGLFYGVRYISYALAHETTDDAQVDADLFDVTSKIAERVDKVLADTNQEVRRGQLLVQLDDADERQRVAQAQANVDAQVAQAKAAQENVALTSDTQRAQNQQSAGAIAQAQANVQSAADMARSASQQIAVAQAGADAAAAQLKAAQDGVPGAYQNLLKAQADLNRTSSLVKTGDLSLAQLDAARAAYEAARSTYAQTQANVAAAQATLAQAQQRVSSQRSTTSSSQAQIGVEQGQLQTAAGKLAESEAPNRVPAQQAQANAASAQVESLQAQLSNAKNQLAYTRIVSPADGYVGQKTVEVGQTVAPGQSLMTIVPHRVYVTANYKETQIKNMRVGQPVDIGVDACSGIPLHGHVENLSPAAQNKFSLVPPQNATGNFVKVTQRLPVRIAFDNPDPRCGLRPGLSVTASVKVK